MTEPTEQPPTQRRIPGSQRRMTAFRDERRAGGPRVAGFETDVDLDPIALRRAEQVAEFRLRTAAARDTKPKRRRGRAGLLPAAAPGPNWVPIGPFAVRRGQADGEPVVAGRVNSVAISTDGARVYAASANGGVWRSADAGHTWEPTMDGVDIDPQGTSEHADTLSCGAIALVEGANQAADRLYLGSGAPQGVVDYRGTGMWISRNGGTSWLQEPASVGALTDVLHGNGVFAIAVNPDDPEDAVAATSNGLFVRQITGTPGWPRETPAGIAPNAKFTSVVAAKRPTGVEFYAAPFAGSPITRQAAGWVLLGTGFPTNQTGRITLGVSKGDNPVLYALIAYTEFQHPLGTPPGTPIPDGTKPDGFLHGLWRLDFADAPLTWHKIEGVPDKLFGRGDSFQGDYDQAVVVDPSDPNRVYLGGSHSGGPASVYRCEVNADAFTADCTNIGAHVHPDIHGLTIRPNAPAELWVACDGGVFTTTNARGGPELFQARNTGLSTMTIESLAGHPNEDAYAFAGVQDNGGIRYTGSEIWENQLPGDGGAALIHQGDPTKLLNIYTNDHLRRASLDSSRWSYSSVGPSMPDVRTSPPAAKSQKAESPLFYPPVEACPDAPDTVAFGAERPWVSTSFGGGWTALPFPTGLPNATSVWPKVRSLAFASPTRLYAGYTDGRLFRWEFANGNWGPALDLGAPTMGATGPIGGLGGRSITSITIDPADAANSCYLTVGGPFTTDRVFRVTVGPPPAAGAPTITWAAKPEQPAGGPAVPAADQLLDSQHNCLVVDPDNHQHLYVGADIGVWRSVNGGQTWTAFSPGLPDAPVLGLAVVAPQASGNVRLLRAATYGRGAWEIPLDGVDQPAIELVLRANELDRRGGRAPRGDIGLPTNPGFKTRLDRSPDIRLDPPDSRGQYVIDATRPVDMVRLEDRCTGDKIGVGVPAAPVVTQVHVVVRSRGVHSTDGTTATLLVGRMPDSGDAVPALPAGWAADVRAGTAIDTGTWKTVGTRTVNGLHAGRPVIATFELPSAMLPPAGESDGHRFALIAVLHNASDALPDATTVVSELVTSERRVALRVATGASMPSANPNGAPGGAGLVVPLTTVLLAKNRLDDAVTKLEAKLAANVSPPAGTAPATVRLPERQILALAKAAKSNVDGGPTAGIEAGRLGAGIGSFALLGALGFELPGYTGLLAPGGDWVGDFLRRGTPDPQLSLVKVPATEVPLKIATRALSGADVDVSAKVRAFTSGMLGAAAAGLVVGPQLTDLLAVDTHRDWSRYTPSAGAAAVEDAIRRRFLSTAAGVPVALPSWLPGAGAVPGPLWDGYAATLGDVVGTPAARPKGWAAFEAGFDAGDPISATRLRNAYGLLLSDLHTDSLPAIAWWWWLVPLTMAIPVSLLFARELPHGRNFFTENADIDERAIHELLTVGFGVGAFPSLLYSMVLWCLVDEHTEVFVTSLLMGLARGALVGGALGTAKDESQSAEARWLGFFPALASMDIYALIRALVAGSRRPGDSFVFGMQTFPVITAVSTLGISAILKAADISHTDAGFWAPWAVLTAGLVFGAGIPIAMALANGGGYSSWFRRDRPPLPVLSATGGVTAPKPDVLAKARTFGPDQLWALPTVNAPALTDLRYPPGMRPLVRVWWEGAGDLEVRPADNEVVFRQGATDTTIPVPAGTTVPALVTLLTGALAGVKAEPEGAGDPPVPLPAPSLADNGDDGLAVDAPVGSTRFVPVGRTKAAGVLLRNAPRFDVATPVGLGGALLDPFPVVPAAALTDLDATGLGHAADLAALLAMAAAPSLGRVDINDALPAPPESQLPEVAQVFRRWNLDERRLAEWRQLVAGGGASDTPAAGVDPMIRELPAGVRRPHPAGEPVAVALGWVPLWRAWLRVAADPLADTTAAVAHGSTPDTTMPDGLRKPTNAELTDGVRFLLDLGDPPP